MWEQGSGVGGRRSADSGQWTEGCKRRMFGEYNLSSKPTDMDVKLFERRRCLSAAGASRVGTDAAVLHTREVRGIALASGGRIEVMASTGVNAEPIGGNAANGGLHSISCRPHRGQRSPPRIRARNRPPRSRRCLIIAEVSRRRGVEQARRFAAGRTAAGRASRRHCPKCPRACSSCSPT
jgi:hypothetical protein